MSVIQIKICVKTIARTHQAPTPVIVELDIDSAMTVTGVMVCKHLKFIECALGCTDNDTDTDIDECMEQIHQCTHTCQNTMGSYICNCKDGFRLQPNNRSCYGMLLIPSQ